MVGVFPGGAKGADFEAFSAAASAMRSDYEFAHVTNAALVAQAKGEILAGPACGRLAAGMAALMLEHRSCCAVCSETLQHLNE